MIYGENTESKGRIKKGKLNKEDEIKYKEVSRQLRSNLGALQRKASELKIPIIIIFEGASSNGKGSLINDLIINLDPRFIKIANTHNPNDEENLRPFLWSYWRDLPAKGITAISYRSWYSRLIYNKLKDNLKTLNINYEDLIGDINNFEESLCDEGYVIIKFFLETSKKTQREEIKVLRKNPFMKWKAKEYEEIDYEKYNKTVSKLIEQTNNDGIPWYILNAEDKKTATLQMYAIIKERIIKAIEKIKDKTLLSGNDEFKANELSKVQDDNNEKEIKKIVDIRSVDLHKTLSKEECKERIQPLHEKIRELQYALYKKRIALIILYEGWDAAGKGGSIKRVIKSLDPAGYEVIPIAKPNAVERQYHYLWRFWIKIPKAGHIAIFDRSWYGRVLVERVEGLITREQYNRSYDEINQMEKTLTSSKTILIKLFLHIDKEEQLKRFKAREANPDKNWKITEEDYRNREKWEEYIMAINDMINYTSTEYAPWNIIEGNCKSYTRIKVLETVINIIEDKLKIKN